MADTNRGRNRLIAAVVVLGFLAVVAGVLLTSRGSTAGDVAAIEVPELVAPAGPLAPAVEFAMFDGSTASFADYRGRPLVVNFWASWCPSCVAEMSAAFKPVQETLGDRVAFLGLNHQDARSEAIRLVEETGVLFDLGDDPVGDVYTELWGLGMPFTVFIAADGTIVEKHNGPLTEGQLLDKIIESFDLS